MEDHFKKRSAASITADEAQHWIKSLVTKERSARTVENMIAASKTIFRWAAKRKYVPRNAFKKVEVTIQEQINRRETKAFLRQEWRTILKAALETTDTSKPFTAAQRWMPWLLAYTGARPGEVAQLRKCDVIERDGTYALNLTPEAGSIKNRKARTVPLHEHIIAQGFLKFVDEHSEGPLFYKSDQNSKMMIHSR